MITVTLFGAAGRMGKTVVQAFRDETDVKIINAVDIAEFEGDMLAKGITVEVDDPAKDFKADVWVDVSLADSAVEHALRAEKEGIPILIGTTGFDEEQHEKLRGLSNAHIIAPNLSLGINLLFNVAPNLRKVLGKEYDVAVSETHHRHKLDAPSGTAAKLIELIEEVKGPVQSSSLRLGEVVGEHRVIFASEGEEIELVHRAKSRMAFARGVAPAVRFLEGKRTGSFTMADVLGLR